jgi:hypothetical protein
VPDKDSVWSGQLLDANGRQGSIEVHFDKDKDVVAWKLKLLERDGPSTDMEGQAPLEGRDPSEPILLKMSEELPGGGRVDWELNLEPADAGMFAERAVVGAYTARVEGTEVPLPLSRGVIVAWQFA